MTKIIRKTGNVVPPASSSQAGERSIFGQGTQSDTLDGNYTTELLRGWGIVGPDDEPKIQDFNAVLFVLGQFIAYLHQMGVAEWDAAQEYHAGSSAAVGGEVLHSTIDDNIGNIPGTPNAWSDQGSYLDIPGITDSSVTMLSKSVAIVFDATTETLNAYALGAGRWSDTGVSLAIPGAFRVAISSVSEIDFALVDDGENFLSMYRFNGGEIFQVGASLDLVSIAYPSITSLNSTDVVVATSSNDFITTYRFNGLAWVQVGASLAIPGSDRPAITALNSTDIAFIDQINDEIRMYRFNGSTFAQVGNGLQVFVSDPSIAAMSPSSIALVSGSSIRSVQFDGTDWAIVGVDYALGGIALIPAIASSKNNGIVMLSNDDTRLRVYNYDSAWRGASAKNIGINSPDLLSRDAQSAIIEVLEIAREAPKLDWVRAEKVGAGLTVPADAGSLRISHLSGYDIAQVSDTVIRRFSNDGGAWSEVGSGLVVGGSVFTGIESIGGLDAACSNLAGELVAYRNDGSVWAQLGAAFTAASTITSMSKIGRNRVVCYLSGASELVSMSFDGSVWAQDGVATSLAGVDVRDITSLSATRIVLFDASTLSLVCYDLVGGQWVQNGNPMLIGFASFKGLAAINGTDVSFIDSSIRQIAVYRFVNGWRKIGYGTTIPLGASASIAAIQGGDIAHISSIGELNIYRHHLAPPVHNVHLL